MRVLKFGGTSVATPGRRAIVAEVVARAATRDTATPVVVTSALAGVTNLLSTVIEKAIERREIPRDGLAELVCRHDDPVLGPAEQLAQALRLAELGESLLGVALLGECPHAVRHRILAMGERLAMPLVAAALRQRGLAVHPVDGSELLVTAAADSGSQPVVDLAASRRQLVARRSVPVSAGRPEPILLVTGFVAADAEGRTTTLGRGASDLSATLLAELFGAEAVEIWSDVDGVLDAPPCWVPDARPLERLGYGAASDMARFGARVLHPETLAPARRAGIPVWIRNTLRPEAPGTRIDGKAGTARTDAADAARVAVSGLEDVTLFELSFAHRHASVRRRLRSQLLELFDPPEHRPLFWLASLDSTRLRPVLHRTQADIVARRATRQGLEIRRRDALGAVAVVATGPRARATLLARLLVTLEDHGIDPHGLALAEPRDDGDPPTLVALVATDEVGPTVRSLHRELVRRVVWLPMAKGEAHLRNPISRHSASSSL